MNRISPTVVRMYSKGHNFQGRYLSFGAQGTTLLVHATPSIAKALGYGSGPDFRTGFAADLVQLDRRPPSGPSGSPSGPASSWTNPPRNLVPHSPGGRNPAGAGD